jgi:hypothetical protein
VGGEEMTQFRWQKFSAVKCYVLVIMTLIRMIEIHTGISWNGGKFGNFDEELWWGENFDESLSEEKSK